MTWRNAFEGRNLDVKLLLKGVSVDEHFHEGRKDSTCFSLLEKFMNCRDLFVEMR